ncbi:gamma-aminobutyric acid receptor subunit beta-like [Glandiceps talaboti]
MAAMIRGVSFILQFYAILYHIMVLPCIGGTTDKGSVLEALIKNHDKKVRAYVDGKAVDLQVHMLILSIRGVSEVDMSYTMTSYIQQFWTDPRLEHNLTTTITVDPTVFTSAFWIPHIYVANSCDKEIIHSSPRENSVLYISPNGRLLHSIRF